MGPNLPIDGVDVEWPLGGPVGRDELRAEGQELTRVEVHLVAGDRVIAPHSRIAAPWLG